ncbi:MAG: radical SAM protein [Desulfobacterales bacterium]|jgi:MoaA/NifB/PqqE/SkfB family radical SAM enzyme
MGYLRELLPNMVRYRLAHWGLAPPGKPINLTFSVTNVCQSRCKTCQIWDLYRQDPAKRDEELTIAEISRIFRSMGHIYLFNVSGGEPFLRPDFVEIIAAAVKYLTPGIIHIPTNALALKQSERKISAILDLLNRNSRHTQLTIKPSMDHVGPKHDDIRGVPGNFDKVMELFDRLKAKKNDYPNLHVELGTVISRWNVDDIEEIAAYVTGLGVDSYRNEIAEQRSEMFNLEDDITPPPDQYRRAIALFERQIRANMRDKVLFQRITNAFRLVYYQLAIKIMQHNRQVIPCYAGISNAHMTPYGDIWACCTLGYERSMGNLRDFDYDFGKLWNSPRARQVRRFIRNRHCACPLANQTYSNILMHPRSLMRVVIEIFSAGTSAGTIAEGQGKP